MTDPKVVVWESGPSQIPGYDDLERAASAPLWPVLSLREALQKEYDSDAHLSPVVLWEDGVPEEMQPRLNLPALHEAQDEGYSPLITAVFVDIDNVDHRTWTSVDIAEKSLRKVGALGELRNAHLYTTRAGWRAVFEVTPPIPLDRLPDTMGQPYEHKGTPAYGLLGWLAAALPEGVGEVDRSCRDRNRCYRAPYVMRNGQPTSPFCRDPLDATPLDVSRWLDAAAPAPRKATTTVGDLTRPDMEALSQVVWAGMGITGHLSRRMPSHTYKGDKIPSLDTAIRNQVPFFGPSQRNVATHSAVTLLLDLIYENTDKSPQEAAELTYWAIGPCVEEAVIRGVASTDLDEALDETWSMIERHSGVAMALREKRDAAAERARATREKLARVLSPDVPEVTEGDEGHADGDDLTDEVTEDDLYPLIAWGSNWFVLDARDEERPSYYAPTNNMTVVNGSLLRGCGSELGGPGEGPLGLELHYPDGKVKPLKDVYQEYGTFVTDVVTAHGRALPRLDVERYRLELPGVVALDVKPRFHKEIATWLDLLGGDDKEALLDWLATCTRLDRPTCALYLQGVKGAGKSFFAMCVSSVFGVGFVDFVEATSRFNSHLAKSPVIFLDEKAVTRDRSDVSGMFRSLVANTEHRVEAKGQPQMTIRGACRVIVASNNADALPLSCQHTEADIDAIAARIRWIGIDPEAATYLESLGGRDGTPWLGSEGQPGAFAAHVRWLELNRDVKPGGRFLVEGRMREYHEVLALTTERLSVLNAVLHALLIGKGGANVVQVDDGDLLVHVKALRTSWFQLTKERVAKTQGEITSALSALTGVTSERGKGLFRDKRVYRVPSKYLLIAAESLGLPAWEVKKRIGHETPETP